MEVTQKNILLAKNDRGFYQAHLKLENGELKAIGEVKFLQFIIPDNFLENGFHDDYREDLENILKEIEASYTKVEKDTFLISQEDYKKLSIKLYNREAERLQDNMERSKYLLTNSKQDLAYATLQYQAHIKYNLPSFDF